MIRYLALAALLLSVLACRPVFAIGWTELLILIVIIAVLLGPVLLRAYRLFEKIRNAENDAKKK
jgi:hypothetical protein